MHKLYEYVCDELKDLEKKAERGNLSMQEVQYADTLAHLKKNLMKADEMMEDEYGEYSMAYYPMTSYAEEGGMKRGRMMGRRSYAQRRDARGRYSSDGYSMANDRIISELRDLMADAPDERVRNEIQSLIHRVEKM